MPCAIPSHTHTTPYDPICKQEAGNISSVVQFARENEMTPEKFVKVEEGTYNPITDHFLCDMCFISEESRLGRRLVGPNGTPWVCP